MSSAKPDSLGTRRAPVVALLVAAFATGCVNLAPKYERPPIELPAEWGTAAQTSVGAQWWKLYGDAQLDGMVAAALAHNATLAVAVARIDEARARFGFARAEQFPTLAASFDGSRTQTSQRTATPLPPGTPRETDSYRATLDTAYELDFWGRLQNSRKAARAELLATESAAETVRIRLAADVVQAYFAARALDAQIAATQRSLAARSESLALQKIRLEVGAISEFEYRQLEGEVLAARAQLPAFERQRAQQESALSVLLGQSPRVIFAAAPLAPNDALNEAAAPETAQVERPQHAVVVPTGLPSALLLRRPDLVEAEQRLIATNARIGVARAGFFPAISLTGSYGSEADTLRDLFSGPAGVWRVAAALTQPIWGAGRATAQANIAHARKRQALAQYEATIQNAFRDVRDAIVAQTKSREQLEVEEQRVGALRDALRLAKLRYENGVASQLDVLDTERTLLAAELSRHEALRSQRAAIADLFKALGGGW